MIKIIAKTYGKFGIEVIVDDNDISWLSQKYIEDKLGHKRLLAIANKYDPIYKEHRYESVN